MSNQAAAGLRVGAEVITNDGAPIGRVAETTGSRLKVEEPGRQAFWLNRAAIADSGQDRVVMAFDRARLKDFCLDGPGSTSDQRSHPEESGGRNFEMQPTNDDGLPAYLRPGSGGHHGSPD